MSNKICVIGAGASGMLAAISAKEHGADVFILERNVRAGRKILATGNGRCNYTNVDATEDNYNHPYFAKSILDQFSPNKTIKYFESLGIMPKIEDEGKTYPYSEQASSILEVLLYEIERLKIKIVYNSFVQDIIKRESGYLIKTNEQSYDVHKVIISTGGKALPRSGSDGNGYELSKKLGHEITPIFPSLVKLELDYPYLKQMDGVKIKAKAELIDGEKVLHQEYGDVLFTKYGISGPTILQISRKANALLLEGHKLYIKVTLINDLEVFELIKLFKNLSDKPMEIALLGIIPKKLVQPLLKESGIQNINSLVRDLSGQELKKVIDTFYDWRFLITKSRGFDDAQVTAGGVNLNNINNSTLESNVQKGVYFTGEVLDIDALCGGYNLQWAWSSGYVAGKHAALSK